MYLQNGRAEHIRIWARLQSYTIDCSCVLQQTLSDYDYSLFIGIIHLFTFHVFA
jgi:hypothetical protein